MESENSNVLIDFGQSDLSPEDDQACATQEEGCRLVSSNQPISDIDFLDAMFSSNVKQALQTNATVSDPFVDDFLFSVPMMSTSSPVNTGPAQSESLLLDFDPLAQADHTVGQTDLTQDDPTSSLQQETLPFSTVSHSQTAMDAKILLNPFIGEPRTEKNSIQRSDPFMDIPEMKYDGELSFTEMPQKMNQFQQSIGSLVGVEDLNPFTYASSANNGNNHNPFLDDTSSSTPGQGSVKQSDSIIQRDSSIGYVVEDRDRKAPMGEERDTTDDKKETVGVIAKAGGDIIEGVGDKIRTRPLSGTREGQLLTCSTERTKVVSGVGCCEGQWLSSGALPTN